MKALSLLAIDPGKSECACVLFQGGALTAVAFGNGPFWDDGAVPPLDAVVVERMQADERTRSIDVRDLLECQFNGARAAGIASGGYCPIVDYTPTQWKGSEPKPAQHARLIGAQVLEDVVPEQALTDAEVAILVAACGSHGVRRPRGLREIVADAVEAGALNRWGKPGHAYYPAKWAFHNILDAVALGCFHLGRLEKR